MLKRGASYLTGAGALAAAAWPLIVTAQGIPEADGGARLEAGIDLRLELDNGDPEFRTGFNLDLITATRTQRLTFSGDFGLVVPLEDIEAAEFSDPSYGLNYLRDNGRSRLTFSGNYSDTDVDSLRTLEDDADTVFDESTLTTSETGSRERYDARFGMELGLTDPIGGELRYTYSDTIYTGVTDPDLEDTRRDLVSGSMRFDVDTTLRFTVDAQWGRTQTEGVSPEDEVDTRLGAGFNWQARPELSLNGNVSYTQVVTDTTILGVTTRTERDGVNLNFGADLDRPNGGYSFSFSRTLNAPGYVTTASVGVQYDLPRGATLQASVGATELPSGDIFPISSLRYDRETRRGNLSLSLARSAAINGDDEAVERTILSGSYGLDMPRDAGLSVSGRLTESDYTLATVADISSARLSLNYNLPLTEDWGLGAGVSWQVTREDGSPDDTDSRVFLSLERRFTLRR